MDDQNPIYLTVREIRVWSQEDLASSGVVIDPENYNIDRMVGPLDNFCILQLGVYFSCKDKGDHEMNVATFYLDLGSEKTLSGIWVLFGNEAMGRICMGYSDTVPAINDHYYPPNKICVDSSELY